MFPGMPNPIQIIGMMMKNQNPKNMVIDSLKRTNNEASINLANMIQNGDARGIEQLARNAAREKGINIDDLKSNLERQFNIRY